MQNNNKIKNFYKKYDKNEDDDQLDANDVAFIDPLNNSIDDREEDDFDDPQAEQQFTAMIQDIQKEDVKKENDEKDFLSNMNQLMESSIDGNNKTFNDDFLFDTNKGIFTESFSNPNVKQILEKEVMFQPLLKSRKFMQEYMGKSSQNINQLNKDKLKLITEALQIYQNQKLSPKVQKGLVQEKLEAIQAKGGIPKQVLNQSLGVGGDSETIRKLAEGNSCTIF